MLVRDVRRLILLVGPLLVFFYVAIVLYGGQEGVVTLLGHWVKTVKSKSSQATDVVSSQKQVPWSSPEAQSPDSLGKDGFPKYQKLYSISTRDRKYFPIDFGNHHGMNPNIIPHPTLKNTWIVTAQRRGEENSVRFAEFSCNAVFKSGKLKCLEKPAILPIASTTSPKCEGELAHFNFNVGPHDARVFMGPEKPYIIYGSQSRFNCFGQFVQDFRLLADDWHLGFDDLGSFRLATDLQRPPPIGEVEKNWFLFWDNEGEMYLHYDLTPKRVYAHVQQDGSVGPNLAPLAAHQDGQCLAKYLPHLPPQLESIHQATNSLRITMCERAKTGCVADDSNTFLFTIFQHKTYYGFHSAYDPYVMVFQERAPFEVYALSSRPLWIHGRENHPERNTSDMFYVTSMSWKNQQQQYHGFLDDELFLAFGIEDDRAGGIDLRASDLFGGLMPCKTL